LSVGVLPMAAFLQLGKEEVPVVMSLWRGSRRVSLPREGLAPERGQSTVEFALVLPALFLVFLLFAQAVLVLHARLAVAAAAREGARKGVETGDRGAVEEAARRAAVGLDRSKLLVKVEEGGRKRGDWVGVEVEYLVPVVFPLVGGLIPEVKVRDRSEMRIENDRGLR